MRLLIDGDGCPNRQELIALAAHYNIETHLFIDYAHLIDDDVILHQCEIGKDSVDSCILEFLYEGDLVVTQDYGLASLALMKDAVVVHVSGKLITENNINNLLMARYMGHVSRKANKHIKGPKKRKQQTADFFLRNIEKIFIEEKFKKENSTDV